MNTIQIPPAPPPPPEEMTVEKYRKLYEKKPHKYNAKRTDVDGHSFPSKAEANRYLQLKLLLSGKKIRDLEIQPRFPLVVNGVKITTYIADFRYVDIEKGLMIIEDVKGVRTEGYVLKKKLTEALYGIEITEITQEQL